MKRTLLLILIGLGHAAPAAAADALPSDPAASAPAASYRSVFEGYRPFREEPIADWKALNAEVGAAGGHVGILGGAGGHGGHAGGAAKPGEGKPLTSGAGQAPARGAPSAPGGKAPAASGSSPSPRAPAGGAHSQH